MIPSKSAVSGGNPDLWGYLDLWGIPTSGVARPLGYLDPISEGLTAQALRSLQTPSTVTASYLSELIVFSIAVMGSMPMQEITLRNIAADWPLTS